MADAPVETPAPTPPGPEPGYVFLCRNETQMQCLDKSLFALKEGALERMKTAITADTQIFLLNINSGALIGIFKPVGSPELNIDAEAFGGEFPAQVKVTPVEGMKAVKIDKRVSGGPKKEEDLAKIKEMFSEGESIDPSVVNDEDKGYGNTFKGSGKGFFKGKGKGKWMPMWAREMAKAMWASKGKSKGQGMEGLWMLAYGNKGFGKGGGNDDDDPKGKAINKVVRVLIEQNGGDGQAIKAQIKKNRITGEVFWKEEQVAKWDEAKGEMELMGAAAGYKEAFLALFPPKKEPTP